ncbi:MAG TPA: hypothetical protein VG604_02175 [Candidatus Saccharimonadales bacterium]|nr:hypothetical protein [Candidatus Saccharimonadales bacterium]
MIDLITRLQAQYPNLNFRHGERFSWSPETNEIIYKLDTTSDEASWALLHETGHALLRHQTYQADVELLRMEVEAWQRARELANDIGISIDEDHIQDCLDTYRDWLHKRSVCPTCRTKCLQQDDGKHYRCFNCHTVWQVSSDRFCRPYRSTKVTAIN